MVEMIRRGIVRVCHPEGNFPPAPRRYIYHLDAPGGGLSKPPTNARFGKGKESVRGRSMCI